MTETTPTAAPAPTPAAAEPMRRIFTATLILGVPGGGKTTLLKTFAEYLWEVYRRVLLLYSWDGGAIPTEVQKRVKQGLIRLWRARTRSAPGLGLETLYLASRGCWPRLINPETGETSPAVELVPPVTVRYTATCPKGHQLAQVPVRGMIVPMFCTPCNTFIGMPDLQVTETATRTKGFELVGGVAYDGLTSMSDVVLDHMDLQRGEGLIGGEKAAFGGVVKSGSLGFGGNNRADIGFGQSRARQFVQNSLSIPHLVEGPVFTALSFEASDEGGLSIVGAKLPGRAATDDSSAWFGNVMEMGKTVDDTSQSHFTLYLRPYIDPQGRRHLLKTSASPTGLPDVLIDPPEAMKQPNTVANLGNVFRMLDEDLRRSLTEEVAGAPVSPADYGDELTATTAPTMKPGVGGTPFGLATAPGLMTPVPRGTPAVTQPAAPTAPGPIATRVLTEAAIVVATASPNGPSTSAVPSVPSTGATAAAAGQPLMVASPSAKRRRAAGPPTVPAQPPPVAAPGNPTASPPPPGLKPPMRAPGS